MKLNSARNRFSDGEQRDQGRGLLADAQVARGDLSGHPAGSHHAHRAVLIPFAADDRVATPTSFSGKRPRACTVPTGHLAHLVDDEAEVLPLDLLSCGETPRKPTETILSKAGLSPPGWMRVLLVCSVVCWPLRSTTMTAGLSVFARISGVRSSQLLIVVPLKDRILSPAWNPALPGRRDFVPRLTLAVQARPATPESHNP